MKLRQATHRPNCERLAQRVARLAQQLSEALERMGRREEENAHLRQENAQLCQQKGIHGCDFFGAYRKLLRECDVLVQICLAHLICDVKFLLTLPGRDDQAYGERVQDTLPDLRQPVNAHGNLDRSRS